MTKLFIKKDVVFKTKKKIYYLYYLLMEKIKTIVKDEKK